MLKRIAKVIQIECNNKFIDIWLPYLHLMAQSFSNTQFDMMNGWPKK